MLSRALPLPIIKLKLSLNSRLLRPCDQCEAPYGYKNHMTLSVDTARFSVSFNKDFWKRAYVLLLVLLDGVDCVPYNFGGFFLSWWTVVLCAELCLRVFYFHYRFLFDLIIFVLLALLGFSENTHLLYLFHFFHCKYCLILFISRLLSTFVRRFFFSFLKQNFSKLSQFLPIVSLWLIECFLFVVRCIRSVITNPAKPCKWAEKRSVNK